MRECNIQHPSDNISNPWWKEFVFSCLWCLMVKHLRKGLSPRKRCFSWWNVLCQVKMWEKERNISKRFSQLIHSEMRRADGGRRACEWTRHNWTRHTTNCSKQIQISWQNINKDIDILKKYTGCLVKQKRKDAILNVIEGSDLFKNSYKFERKHK